MHKFDSSTQSLHAFDLNVIQLWRLLCAIFPSTILFLVCCMGVDDSVRAHFDSVTFLSGIVDHSHAMENTQRTQPNVCTIHSCC